MCEFMFSDILNKAAYATFFRSGNEFDASFSFEVSFGFIPREFQGTVEDRYLYEEEGDVTEIYFITSGNWCIAFDSFAKDSQIDNFAMDNDDLGLNGTLDMHNRGILVAIRR